MVVGEHNPHILAWFGLGRLRPNLLSFLAATTPQTWPLNTSSHDLFNGYDPRTKRLGPSHMPWLMDLAGNEGKVPSNLPLGFLTLPRILPGSI